MTIGFSNRALRRASLLWLLIAACANDAPVRDGDGAKGQPDGGEPSPDGGGPGPVHPHDDGGQADAGEPRADAGDPSADAGEGDLPIEGGPGCGAGSLCLALRNAYGEALQDAKSCVAGDHASCGQSVAGSLGCDGCPVWVTDAKKLEAIAAQFDDAACNDCFYGSPTGDRCHPVVCEDLGTPMCSASGTCVADLTCPDGVAHDGPCDGSSLLYCEHQDGKSCLCFSDSWSCS